jgi:hypothetical protein
MRPPPRRPLTQVIHLMRRHQKHDMIADGRKIRARAFLGMWRREGRGVGGLDGGGDPIVQRLKRRN